MLLLREMCLGFHWIKFGWWTSDQPIEYKVYTDYVILASLFNMRQRKKDKMTAMKTRNAVLWLLAGKTVNSFLRDWVSKWGDMKFLPTGWHFNTFIVCRQTCNLLRMHRYYPCKIFIWGGGGFLLWTYGVFPKIVFLLYFMVF